MRKRHQLSMRRRLKKKRHLHHGRRLPQERRHQGEEEEGRKLWKVRMRMKRMKMRMMSRFGNSRERLYYILPYIWVL